MPSNNVLSRRGRPGHPAAACVDLLLAVAACIALLGTLVHGQTTTDFGECMAKDIGRCQNAVEFINELPTLVNAASRASATIRVDNGEVIFRVEDIDLIFNGHVVASDRPLDTGVTVQEAFAPYVAGFDQTYLWRPRLCSVMDRPNATIGLGVEYLTAPCTRAYETRYSLDAAPANHRYCQARQLQTGGDLRVRCRLFISSVRALDDRDPHHTNAIMAHTEEFVSEIFVQGYVNSVQGLGERLLDALANCVVEEMPSFSVVCTVAGFWDFDGSRISIVQPWEWIDGLRCVAAKRTSAARFEETLVRCPLAGWYEMAFRDRSLTLRATLNATSTTTGRSVIMNVQRASRTASSSVELRAAGAFGDPSLATVGLTGMGFVTFIDYDRELTLSVELPPTSSDRIGSVDSVLLSNAEGEVHDLRTGVFAAVGNLIVTPTRINLAFRAGALARAGTFYANGPLSVRVEATLASGEKTWVAASGLIVRGDGVDEPLAPVTCCAEQGNARLPLLDGQGGVVLVIQEEEDLALAIVVAGVIIIVGIAIAVAVYLLWPTNTIKVKDKGNKSRSASRGGSSSPQPAGSDAENLRSGATSARLAASSPEVDYGPGADRRASRSPEPRMGSREASRQDAEDEPKPGLLRSLSRSVSRLLSREASPKAASTTRGDRSTTPVVMSPRGRGAPYAAGSPSVDVDIDTDEQNESVRIAHEAALDATEGGFASQCSTDDGFDDDDGPAIANSGANDTAVFEPSHSAAMAPTAAPSLNGSVHEDLDASLRQFTAFADVASSASLSDAEGAESEVLDDEVAAAVSSGKNPPLSPHLGGAAVINDLEL